jgi:hypothetical protein
MSYLNTVWGYILPYLPVIITATISAIITVIIKKIVDKALSKIDSERVANQATDACLNKIKDVSFEHTIKPLVDSELIKVREEAKQIVKDEVKEIVKGNNDIIAILQALKTYFDDSAFISQDKKDNVQAIIDNAREQVVEPVESKVVIITDEQTPKREEKAVKKVQR